MNRNVLVFCGLCILLNPLIVKGQTSLEDDWNDFLHYTVIGRFDLAAGFAQKVIDSNSDPLELLKLSEDNPRGYAILVRVHANNPELAPLAAKILDIIEKGRFMRRSDIEIITMEIKRLSSTVRGKYTAIERLRNAGEYAIPFMLDALADEQRREEFPNITTALPEIGKAAVRPLTASLAMDNAVVKGEVIKALGKIGYPEALGYLKYIAENDSSDQLRGLAKESINQIDSASAGKSAAELFFATANNYYYKAESLAPVTDGNSANIWFWDKQAGRLVRQAVDKSYFHELMAMRSCEWALRADKDFGQAISLWLAAFFRTDGKNIQYPEYFGQGHAKAMTYATTAGAEYLHQALERAVKDNDTVVALGAVEALARNAGEKSLMYRLQTSQPLIEALSFNNRAVRYSAAIALAMAQPAEKFAESELVVKGLAEALAAQADTNWPAEKADNYAFRSAQAMLKLAETRNKVIDLAGALDALVKATDDKRDELKIFSCQILAYMSSPQAQRAIAEAALKQENSIEIRISSFEALIISAKVNANLLLDGQIDQIYQLVESRETNEDLRSSAATALGALNLPSRKVKDLILDQSKT
ncbi:MAG: HEAT repeat domain-containing protein [Planctomycetes bacterium]|nr:HEAT repeat domain-containing protein [Planctomycetota bacterium]MBU1518541.1 HEAT repeat domain-containing protein [Planctomycetota bacterium]MBU2458234.1 HEAT repeat domain-containing protein [Planctomycetota bacterium]MBU2597222.1 HEAT repeat domain-containing protein [Planctomycetota bacterium]